MELFAACPFTLATLAWEPASGRRSLSVCVKATFALAPDAVATIALVQEPFAVDGELGAVELCPFKPRADVVIVGHAYAPRGQPTDMLLARARVGPVRKALSVTGDRTWVPSFDGLRPSPPAPFRRMPLRYERAVRAGENLGGIDVLAQGAELGRALPNIAAIADQGGETPGFGPLPLPWRARRFGVGDAGLLWASRVALAPGPPPAGFDFRMLNAAPAEQQIDEIPPGVDVQLENLHPEHAWLESRLPLIRIRLFRKASRADRAAEISVRCDTLVIDADRGLCSVIWRGAVPLEGADESAVGRLVIAAEGEGERIGPEHAERLFAQLAPPVTYVEAGPAFGLAPGAAAAVDAGPSSYPPPAHGGTVPPAPPMPREEIGPRAGGYPPPVAPPIARPITAIPPAPPQQPGALPFRAQPTGFEPTPLPEAPPQAFAQGARPAPGHDSYPPPPAPMQALVAAVARAAAVHQQHLDEDGEATPPRGYALPPPQTPPILRSSSSRPPGQHYSESAARTSCERTATGTILPPPSAPPPRGSGTVRPEAPVYDGGTAAKPPAAPMPAAPQPNTSVVMAPPSVPRPTPTPTAPDLTVESIERTAKGTIRPPGSTSFVGLPFTRPAQPAVADGEAPAGQPPPSMAQGREAGRAPDPAPGLPLSVYAAIKLELWSSGAPLADVLARHGVDAADFHAHERAQAEAMAREAADGRADRATAVFEALRAAR